MIALLTTEMRRMLSRRLLRVLALLVVVIIVVAAAIAFFHSSRDTASARRRLEAQRRETVRACVREEFPIPGHKSKSFNRERACERFVGRGEVPDPRWHYTQLRDVLLFTSPPLEILCLLLGASFIGAEWQKGTVTTALTWEPRRVRLLLVKFVAIALIAALAALLLQLVLAAALWPVAALRGSTAGLDATWLRGVMGIALRIAAVGGLSAVVGCAIATVGRNTTAAIGVAFVYFAVLEGFIRGLRPRWQPWLLGDNAAQFIAGDPVGPAMADKTTFDVAVTLVLYAALFIAAATVFFKSRDVT
jgi:ABC-2 type transport system permease protein